MKNIVSLEYRQSSSNSDQVNEIKYFFNSPIFAIPKVIQRIFLRNASMLLILKKKKNPITHYISEM